MSKNEEGNYYKKFRSKEIRIPKNPFSTGKGDQENEVEKLPLINEQISNIPEESTVVSIIRKYQDKKDFNQPVSDEREATKKERWHEIEQEFEIKMDKIKQDE